MDKKLLLQDNGNNQEVKEIAMLNDSNPRQPQLENSNPAFK